MAKKTKLPTKIIAGIGAGSIGIVVVIISVIFFGNEDVLPPLPVDAELMLPIDEINEHNKMIDEKIQNEFGECDEEMFALEPEICAEDQQMIKEFEDKKNYN